MVFSSPVFLFLFLPTVLGLHFLVPRKLRNLVLLVASLLFYAWGETFFVLIMLCSITANYLLGVWIDHVRERPTARLVLVLTVLVNIGLLGTFKYANFIIDNLNVLLGWAALGTIGVDRIHLPIGISFFTFQAMSYVIDVYRGEAERQKNPVNVALYISLFPQLIAGPIVRYRDVARQLVSRVIDREGFASGVRRFIIGLGKKVLIANTMALPADKVFALAPDQLTPGTAWLGVACYTLQIYFDFSGYSDMAIGLGRMFGLHFLENFNFPYISKSVREFWRRWHISLSTWFRDYLYVPLGGSRRTPARTYLNLVIVFFLCGLWHGASWTFVVWGIYHGVFLVIERLGLERRVERLPRPVRHLYTMLVVVVGWVLFRSETFGQAVAFLASMAGFAGKAAGTQSLSTYLNAEVVLVLVAGAIGSTPVLGALSRWRGTLAAPGATANQRSLDVALSFAALAGYVLVFLACAMSLSAGTYNPFIYFRF